MRAGGESNDQIPLSLSGHLQCVSLQMPLWVPATGGEEVARIGLMASVAKRCAHHLGLLARTEHTHLLFMCYEEKSAPPRPRHKSLRPLPFGHTTHTTCGQTAADAVICGGDALLFFNN